jgi:hypothetical protein
MLAELELCREPLRAGVLRCEEDGVRFPAACFSLDALIVLLRPELGVENEGEWLVKIWLARHQGSREVSMFNVQC